MPVTSAGHHIRINAVDTKANILAIGTGNLALHGRAYLVNNQKEIYFGNFDGTLTKIGGGTDWVARDSGLNTLSISNGDIVDFIGENLISARINSGQLKFGLNTTGAISGSVPTWDGSSVIWSLPAADYITGITDSTSIDFTVTSGNLMGVVKLDSAGDNNISITGNGLYTKKYIAGSGININPTTYEISINSLAIADVRVDTVSATINAWVTSNYTGTEVNEGDTIILTNATGGRQAWIHNGGTAGTVADFTLLNDELTASEVRAYLSAVNPLAYNSTTGAFSLGGLTTFGINGQIVTSTGTGWSYSNLATVVQAYHTIQEEGTALTQRKILNFVGGGFTASDNVFNTRTDITLDATLNALAAYNSNGILTQTAADTFVARTITGTTSRITISNGNGVSGNPIIDIASNYAGQTSISTVGTITTGTWNASIIPMQYGGTGANLTDPNEDRILFWDDSASVMTWLTLGTGLSITGTTINLTAGSDTNPFGIVGGTSKANAMTGLDIWTNNNVYIGDGDGTPAYIPVYKLEVSGDIAFNNALHGIILHTTSGKFRITASSEDGSLITLPV